MTTSKSTLLRSALVAVLFLVFSATGAMAQPGSGGPQPSEPAADPVGIPIDGGASLLLAAGAAYGIKKVNDFRIGKKQEPEA